MNLKKTISSAMAEVMTLSVTATPSLRQREIRPIPILWQMILNQLLRWVSNLQLKRALGCGWPVRAELSVYYSIFCRQWFLRSDGARVHQPAQHREERPWFWSLHQ